jgi:hypothetical protein
MQNDKNQLRVYQYIREHELTFSFYTLRERLNSARPSGTMGMNRKKERKKASLNKNRPIVLAMDVIEQNKLYRAKNKKDVVATNWKRYYSKIRAR